MENEICLWKTPSGYGRAGVLILLKQEEHKYFFNTPDAFGRSNLSNFPWLKFNQNLYFWGRGEGINTRLKLASIQSNALTPSVALTPERC